MRYCLAVSLCLVAASARAELFHISKDQAVWLSLSGDFPGWGPGKPGAKAALELLFDFDWEANTMTYGDFWLAGSGGFGFEGRKSYTVGPGQIDEVNFQAWIDPFSSESSTSTVATLTPTEASAYSITGPAHPMGSPLTLTGTYTATGPNSVVEGPWSVSFATTPSVQYTRLVTNMYPQELNLQWEAAAAWSGGGTIVNTEVDGYPVVVGINSISYSMSYPALTRVVPEPGALVIWLIGLLCCVVHRRFR